MYSKQAEKHQQKAIKLISIDSFGRVIAHSQALQFLRTVSKPIAIISIAGPFRTGKSSFLNTLLSTNSFIVTQTTNACTKGIWIWCEPVLAENEDGEITNVLFIDSEGFNNFNENHDKRLIVLTLLISTSFLYNSKGTIDKDSLIDLEYVIEIAQKLKKNRFMNNQPQFYWLLRDFHLELVTEGGATMTEKQYMQKCLSMSKNNLQMGLLETITSFFSTRQCYTFVKPFQGLDEEPSPEFIGQLIEFKKKLYEIKTTTTIDGQALSQIIQTYVNSMNEDNETTTMLKEGENCQLRLECLSKIEDEVSRCVNESEVREIAEEKQKVYKKKMYSQKQIRYLEKEVEKLVEKSSQQIRNSFGAIESHKNTQKRTKPEQRKIRFSLNIKEFDETFEHPICKTFSKIENEHSMQKIHEDLEGKLYRLNLELQASQNQVMTLKEENKKLNEEKGKMEDEVCEQSRKWAQKEVRYIDQMMWQKQQMQEIKKTSVLENSELKKENNLKDQKIRYLQEKMNTSEVQKREYLKAVEAKYKDKIAYLSNENEQLTFKHENELRQLKNIYQIEEDKPQIGQPTSKQTKFDSQIYAELKDKVLQIERVKNENEQLLMKVADLDNQLQIQGQQIELMENEKKERKEMLTKKKKSETEQMESIYIEKLRSKDELIWELEGKVQELQKGEEGKLQNLVVKENEFCQELEKLQQGYEEEICFLKKENIEINKKLELYLDELNLKEKGIKCEVLKYDKLQNNMSEKEKQLTHLLKNFKQSKLQHEEELTKKQKLIEELKDEITTLQNDLNQEKNSNNQSLNSIRNMMKIQSERQEQKIEQLSQQVWEKKELEKQIEEIKFQIQKESNEREEEEQVYKEERTKLEFEMNGLQVENEYLKKENKKLESNVNQLTSAINSKYLNLDHFIRNDNKKNQAKIEQLMNKLNEKDKELYKVLELASESKKLVVVLENENKKIKKELGQMERGGRHQDERLKEANAELNRQNGELKKELELLKQKCEFQAIYEGKKEEERKTFYENEKGHLEKKIGKLQKKLEDMVNENKKQRETIDILEKDRKETMKGIREMRDNYERNIMEYENDGKLVRQKYKQAKEENEELKQTIQQCKKQYLHLEDVNKLVSQNYENDFKLWEQKLYQYEKLMFKS